MDLLHTSLLTEECVHNGAPHTFSLAVGLQLCVKDNLTNFIAESTKMQTILSRVTTDFPLLPCFIYSIQDKYGTPPQNPTATLKSYWFIGS